MERTFNKVEQLQILTYQDFLYEKQRIEEKGYPFSIFVEKLDFLEYSEDLLVLEDVEGGAMYIVSGILKERIEKAGITGVEFQPSHLSLNEWLSPAKERENIYGKANA